MKAKFVRFAVVYLVGMVAVWFGLQVLQNTQPKPLLDCVVVGNYEMVCEFVNPSAL